MVVTEGKYDSLVTRLTGDILRYFKEGVDSGDSEIYFEKYVVDEKSNLEFDLYMTLKLNDTDTWGVLDGSGANTGKAGSHDPMIQGIFTVDKSNLPKMYREMAFTLRDFLRHEIEHLTQGGQNLRPTKKKNVMRQQRIDIGKGVKPRFKYPMLKSEIEPMLQGMYFRAKKERRPFIDVVDDWFNTQGYTRDEKQTILKLWNKYIPTLNLPKLVLREEEDWTVDNPSPEWNVETLTVGDTITPDMFKDQYRFYDFDLYIKEIGYDDEYEYDDDMEGDFYVTTEFDNSAKKYLHNQHTWWFHEINNYLKPEYKVVQSLSESEEEDWTVDEPSPEWNVTDLGVGDTVTSNMFKIIGDRRHWMDRVKELEILKFSNLGVTGIVHLSLPNQNETYVSWVVDNVNKDLKSNYRIALPLHESDDEDWTVDKPSQAWNQHELKVGDYFNEYTKKVYTRKEEIPENEKNFTYEVIYIGPNEGEYSIVNYYDHNIVVFKSVRSKSLYRFTVQYFNETRGPILNAYINLPDRFSLNESDDDWTVDEPSPSWNEIELHVGDYITPEMYKENHPHRSDPYFKFQYFPSKIIGFEEDDPENPSTVVWLEYEDKELGGRIKRSVGLDTFNDSILKLQYKIYLPNTLHESDDEDWTVNKPNPAWNTTELTVGDTITSNMLNPRSEDFEWFEKNSPWKIKAIYDDNGWSVNINPNPNVNFQNTEFSLNWLNDSILKSKYQIFPPLNESDEDWTVDEPSPEWNQEQLSNGDTITPDMWDKKKTMGINDEIDFSETYKISKVYTVEDWWDEGDQNWFDVYEAELIDSRGVAAIDYLDNINMWLKPEFKVVKPLFESDEDWTVDEPSSEWNVTDLEVGDYIYPEMIKVPRDKRQWNHYHNMLADPKRTYGWKITEFKEFNGRDLVGLEYNGVGNFFDVDQLNKILKQYRIFFPTNENKLSKLLEMDDDWTVDNPSPEWNVKFLTTGDMLDNSNSKVGDKYVYLIKGFYKDINTVILGKGKVGSTKEELMNTYDTVFPVSYVQQKLKPGFNIEIQ